MSNLTIQQELFVAYYCGQHWGHGTNAAKAAGYSEENACQQASRLLTKANIKAAITAKKKETLGDQKAILQQVMDKALGMMHGADLTNLSASDALRAMKLLTDISTAKNKEETAASESYDDMIKRWSEKDANSCSPH